jgi:hypothetical protein
MKPLVSFDKSLIAPCGMNCGTCIAFLRDKNKCPGCRVYSADKAISIQRCIIPKCVYLDKTDSKFCYDCEKYPCKRVKQLDKRYKTKYNTSFIENLTIIKEKGTIWVSCLSHFLLLLLHSRQNSNGFCTLTRASIRNQNPAP